MTLLIQFDKNQTEQDCVVSLPIQTNWSISIHSLHLDLLFSIFNVLINARYIAIYPANCILFNIKSTGGAAGYFERDFSDLSPTTCIEMIIEVDSGLTLAVDLPVWNSNIEQIGTLTNSNKMFTYYLDYTDPLNPVINLSPCCVAPNTLVLTDKGYVCIKDIISGTVVKDYMMNDIKVINTIIFAMTDDFILIEKGAIDGINPLNNMLIREGHPIFINGVEIECQNLVNDDNIKRIKLDEKVSVYSLATSNRTHCIIEGLNVTTFGIDDWNLIKKDKKNPHSLQ